MKMKKILYVCVHNSGRSQMAEKITNVLAHERGIDICAISAGTIAGDKINPIAELAMKEIGMSMEGQHPRQLSPEMVNSADKIITMGCGVDADACPAKFYVTEDWGLDDPAGQSLEKVRVIRDQIHERVQVLIDQIENKDGIQNG
jgi:arsenate reductase